MHLNSPTTIWNLKKLQKKIPEPSSKGKAASSKCGGQGIREAGQKMCKKNPEIKISRNYSLFIIGILSTDLSRQGAQSNLPATKKQQILRHKTHEFKSPTI